MPIKAFTVECRSISLIDSFDWPSIDTSVDVPLTLVQHLGQESTNVCRHAIRCWLILMSQSTHGQLSTDYWSTADQVSIKMFLFSVDQGLTKYSDPHSIAMQMLLVHNYMDDPWYLLMPLSYVKTTVVRRFNVWSIIVKAKVQILGWHKDLNEKHS